MKSIGSSRSGGKPVFANRVGDDLASEREDQARSFDQKERLKRIGGHVPKTEEAGVAEVDDEMDAVLGASRDLDLEGDFVDVVGGASGR